MSAIHAPALTLPQRLVLLIGSLCDALIARSVVEPFSSRTLAHASVRFRRLGRRFEALIARLLSGTPIVERKPRERTAGSKRLRDDLLRQQGLQPPPPPFRLPTAFGWLRQVAPAEADDHRWQLQAWLADPALGPLLKGAPNGGRILRPLLQALAIRTEDFPELAIAKRPRKPNDPNGEARPRRTMWQLLNLRPRSKEEMPPDFAQPWIPRRGIAPRPGSDDPYPPLNVPWDAWDGEWQPPPEYWDRLAKRD